MPSKLKIVKEVISYYVSPVLSVDAFKPSICVGKESREWLLATGSVSDLHKKSEWNGCLLSNI